MRAAADRGRCTRPRPRRRRPHTEPCPRAEEPRDADDRRSGEAGEDELAERRRPRPEDEPQIVEVADVVAPSPPVRNDTERELGEPERREDGGPHHRPGDDGIPGRTLPPPGEERQPGQLRDDAGRPDAGEDVVVAAVPLDVAASKSVRASSSGTCSGGTDVRQSRRATTIQAPVRVARLQCASPSSPTFTQISMRSRRCSRRSTRRTSTRSGASATSSATDPAERVRRGRAGAGRRVSRRQPRPRRASARPISRSSSARPRPRRALDAGRARRRGRRVSRLARAPASRDSVALAHGSPADPVWEYILSQGAAVEAFAATEEPLILVGHSHVALEICLDQLELRGGLAAGGHEVDLNAGRHILNPGSVGQPRDGDARAGWLVIDSGARRATFVVRTIQSG